MSLPEAVSLVLIYPFTYFMRAASVIEFVFIFEIKKVLVIISLLEKIFTFEYRGK